MYPHTVRSKYSSSTYAYPLTLLISGDMCTGQEQRAFTFALLADLLVALPTFIKTYRFPETENWKAYGVSAFGFLLAVVAVHEWSYENYAFVVYLFLLNLGIAVLAARRPTVVVE